MMKLLRNMRELNTKYNCNVILIGEEHHNGLGLVRCFGRNGVRPIGIIIGCTIKDSIVSKSKYWDKIYFVENNGEAIDFLINKYNTEDKRTLIIPWADRIAYYIDKNRHMLSAKYVLPGFSSSDKTICSLMNKYNQVVFAKKNGIPILESIVFDPKNKTEIPLLKYPIIIKPLSGLEGGKEDIRICNNHKECLEVINGQRNGKLIIQPYLKEKIEYVISGAISNKRYSYSFCRNIRQWPPLTGTGSFAVIENDPVVSEFIDSVIKSIAKAGYTGVLDFEIFRTSNNELYLNEINWRCGGRNYISQITGIESIYMYFCDEMGIEKDFKINNEVVACCMNEFSDYKNVKAGEISYFQWIKDIVKTRSFSIINRKDLNPAFTRIIRKICNHYRTEA